MSSSIGILRFCCIVVKPCSARLETTFCDVLARIDCSELAIYAITFSILSCTSRDQDMQQINI